MALLTSAIWTLTFHNSSMLRMWPNVAEPPLTRDVNRPAMRDGTDRANGGWVNCWVLHTAQCMSNSTISIRDLAPES
jgi:hypothetical protein